MWLQLLLIAQAAPGRAGYALALMLTYLIHSAVWTAAAAIFSRRQSLSFAGKNLYWCAALLAPLVTVAVVALAPRAIYAQEIAAPWFAHDSAVAAGAGGVGALPGMQAGSAAPFVSPPLLPLAPLVVAGVGLVRFIGAWLMLRHRLRGRQFVAAGWVLLRLERMRARTRLGPIVLTESGRISSPMVVGPLMGGRFSGHAEICIPRTLPRYLTEAELDTVFAHELAHLERRDGFWFSVMGFVQSILWFHPLNHWLLLRIRETAELACDDRAVALTADPMSLARALTEVAARAQHRGAKLLVPSMAGIRRSLCGRVRRLVEAAGDVAVPGRGIALGWPGIVIRGVLVATVAAGLGVRPAQARRAAPDVATTSQRMLMLVQREHLLQDQLEAALHQQDAVHEGTPAFARVMDLRQQLRHTRAAALWTERTFTDEWTRWQQREESLTAHRRP